MKAHQYVSSTKSQRERPRMLAEQSSSSSSLSLSAVPPKNPVAPEEPIDTASLSSRSTVSFERSSFVAFIAPSAYQVQLLSAFIQTVESSTSTNLVPTFHCHNVWLGDIARRAEESPTLTWTTRAISLSHLGRQVQDQKIIITSRIMYGKALLNLNKALQDPEG
ncbi:hypothetical protein ABVK25_009675 [Lepraria finkii]|uniref:Uncharacterized protein n=1 Tax=Lepraria finkii TaxID=1340010 RepID=A0ABR4AX66_9LECA